MGLVTFKGFREGLPGRVWLWLRTPTDPSPASRRSSRTARWLLTLGAACMVVAVVAALPLHGWRDFEAVVLAVLLVGLALSSWFRCHKLRPRSS